MRRRSSFWLILVGSFVLVSGLGALMLWKDTGGKSEPIVVYCAAAFTEPMKEIVSLYEQQKGVHIEVRYGKSGEILTALKLTKQGDVFLPADDSFIDKAQAEGLLGDVLPLVQMNAVLAVNKQANRSIGSWDDLFKEADAKVAIASEGAAVRELTKSRMNAAKWKQLVDRSVSLGSVAEVANHIALGGAVNAGIIWDSLIKSPQYQDKLEIVPLKELDGMTSTVKIGVLKESPQYSEALAFARFASGSCADIFQKYGFTSIGNPAISPPEKKETKSGRPEILVYAGAMLRPAIEETLKEFEKREGVNIITVYNGCGILVSQMKAAARPDMYFSCDTSFMNQVSDLFGKQTIVSKNQLVIAVKKGNPHGIHSLTDLGKSGLRVGVGHEQQCALGAITQGVLIRTKTLKSITENVQVRSPSGDLLVNQLRTGSLDAVVVYISNVKQYDDIEGIKVEEVNCDPAQPIAVGRNSAHADIVERLIKQIESAQSKERFEKFGFGWEICAMNASPDPPPATGSDRGFIVGLGILGGSYVVLILAMLAADLFFTTPDHLLQSLKNPEIRYAIKLSLVSCTITTILALWVAVPLGYLLARTQFRGKEAVDTVLDIPIVLPPLVIGLSLLILFQTWPGRMIEIVTSRHLGFTLTYLVLPLLVFAGIQLLPVNGWRQRCLIGALGAVVALVLLLLTPLGEWLSATLQNSLGTRITYAVPSVILAQFAVAAAFAVRTMRVTFDQVSPRTEHVAQTLGCSRSQAFWLVTLPQARGGLLTAATLAWARSLGEFGPILIFSGATRMRTEVLSTTVFLELSIGNLYAAIAVSILMVLVAVAVLVLTRFFGLRGTGLI